MSSGANLNRQTSLLDNLVAKWWNWWHTIPVDKAVNWPAPTHGCLVGSGGDITSGESVVFLGNPSFANDNNENRTNQSCQILTNQAIFFPLYNSVCDTSMPKFRVVNYEGMLECAKNANSGVVVSARIDGKDVSNDKVEHYTEKTFELAYPEQNPYLDPPGNYTAVGGGFYLFLKPFTTEGGHDVEYNYHRNDESGSVRYKIHVMNPKSK